MDINFDDVLREIQNAGLRRNRPCLICGQPVGGRSTCCSEACRKSGRRQQVVRDIARTTGTDPLREDMVLGPGGRRCRACAVCGTPTGAPDRTYCGGWCRKLGRSASMLRP